MTQATTLRPGHSHRTRPPVVRASIRAMVPLIPLGPYCQSSRGPPRVTIVRAAVLSLLPKRAPLAPLRLPIRVTCPKSRPVLDHGGAPSRVCLHQTTTLCLMTSLAHAIIPLSHPCPCHYQTTTPCPTRPFAINPYAVVSLNACNVEYQGVPHGAP
jgi:hypothetical protein